VFARGRKRRPHRRQERLDAPLKGAAGDPALPRTAETKRISRFRAFTEITPPKGQDALASCCNSVQDGPGCTTRTRFHARNAEFGAPLRVNGGCDNSYYSNAVNSPSPTRYNERWRGYPSAGGRRESGGIQHERTTFIDAPSDARRLGFSALVRLGLLVTGILLFGFGWVLPYTNAPSGENSQTGFLLIVLGAAMGVAVLAHFLISSRRH